MIATRTGNPRRAAVFNNAAQLDLLLHRQTGIRPREQILVHQHVAARIPVRTRRSAGTTAAISATRRAPTTHARQLGHARPDYHAKPYALKPRSRPPKNPASLRVVHPACRLAVTSSAALASVELRVRREPGAWLSRPTRTDRSAPTIAELWTRHCRRCSDCSRRDQVPGAQRADVLTQRQERNQQHGLARATRPASPACRAGS